MWRFKGLTDSNVFFSQCNSNMQLWGVSNLFLLKFWQKLHLFKMTIISGPSFHSVFLKIGTSITQKRRKVKRKRKLLLGRENHAVLVTACSRIIIGQHHLFYKGVPTLVTVRTDRWGHYTGMPGGESRKGRNQLCKTWPWFGTNPGANKYKQLWSERSVGSTGIPLKRRRNGWAFPISTCHPRKGVPKMRSMGLDGSVQSQNGQNEPQESNLVFSTQ